MSRFLFTARLAVLSLALRSEHYITDGERSGLFDFPLLGYREVGFLKSIGRNSLYHLSYFRVSNPAKDREHSSV